MPCKAFGYSVIISGRVGTQKRACPEDAFRVSKVIVLYCATHRWDVPATLCSVYPT
jgi:hypothetical protein